MLWFIKRDKQLHKDELTKKKELGDTRYLLAWTAEWEQSISMELNKKVSVWNFWKSYERHPKMDNSELIRASSILLKSSGRLIGW